tara:strand:+ start:287 stop:487 length:201 start_codon:yes stop_codon:yes gene_type:complete
MFDINMDEEIDKFYRDRDRFKYLKKMLDFNFEDKDFEGKGIKISPPKYKKKMIRSTFIKTNKKGLF